MEELQRAAVLISLVEHLKERGSWCGETHVQKAVYFLQTLFDVPTGFDYIFYKHGPFSFDLRDKLTALRAYDIFGLQVRQPYGPSIVVKEAGETIKKAYSKSFKRYKDEIDFVATIFEKKNVAELERLSSALFFMKDEDVGGDGEEIAALINKFKPHVTVAEAEIAIENVKQIISDAEARKCA